MSPSKKANKKEAVKKTKSAQRAEVKSPARSSRVPKGTRVKAEENARVQGPAARAKRSVRKVASQPVPVDQVEAAVPVSIPIQSEKPKASLQTNLLRALALLAVIGITVFIYSIRDRVEEFEQFGYFGIFLIALMANATVLLPAPGVAIIYAMGAVFNPLWVGLAAGTGGALGELSGYLAGFSGQAVVEKTNIYNRFHPWVEKYGGWAILVLSAIPNPFFDIAGIAAGIAKMPLRTFLIFTWVGQIIKMTLFAVAGHYSLGWIESLMQ
ncbi:MAG: VTT domain-containing protein [Anaerolineales bacterium]|nr:VTT domain-containing protein [Anaerolineales bacterium]